MVLFLAQNPKTQKDRKKPLGYGKEGKTFSLWLEVLWMNHGKVMYASQKVGKVTWKDYNDLESMRAVIKAYGFTKFVALGDYASGLLERLEIRHFKLPLPTEMPKKLVEKQDILRQLNLCRIYLGGQE